MPCASARCPVPARTRISARLDGSRASSSLCYRTALHESLPSESSHVDECQLLAGVSQLSLPQASDRFRGQRERNRVFTHEGIGRRHYVFHRQTPREGLELRPSLRNCRVAIPAGLRRVVHDGCNVASEGMPIIEKSANLSADCNNTCTWLCNEL